MASITVARRGLSARSPRSVLLVSLLAVAGLLPGAAAADPPRGLLVVEGQGASTVTVELEQEVQLDWPVPELSGGRSHAAVLVEPVDVPDSGGRQLPFGAVRVQAFADETSTAVGTVGLAERLRPGRYRVTLLGDGPVRAVYRLRDPEAPGLRVAPRTRIRTQFFGRTERLEDGRSTASVFLPQVVPAGARALQVGLTAGLSADDYRMCRAQAPQCKGNPLPLCPPVVPCGDERLPSPGVSTGGAGVRALLHLPQQAATGLHWSADGYRDAEGKLRAAAIVF